MILNQKNQQINCLLISDLHFEEIKTEDRQKNIDFFCKILKKFCREKTIVYLFIAGDLSCYLSDISVFFNLLSEMEKTEVIYVTGNHELHVNVHPAMNDFKSNSDVYDIAVYPQDELEEEKQIWKFDSYSKYLKIRETIADKNVHFLHDKPIFVGDKHPIFSETAIIGNMGWFKYDLFELRGINIDAYQHYDDRLTRYEGVFNRKPKDKIWQEGINVPILDPNIIFHDYMISLIKIQLEQIKTRKIKKLVVLTHFLPCREFIPLKRTHHVEEAIENELKKSKNKLFYSEIRELLTKEDFENIRYLCGHTHFTRMESNLCMLQNPQKIMDLLPELTQDELYKYFTKGIFIVQ